MLDSDEIRSAIMEAVSESKTLRAELMAFPEKVEKTVEHFTPVLTGQTVKSVTTKHRRSPYRKLSTRRTKIGEVYSDDDPARVGAIEYGRGDDAEHGGTEGAYMFTRAAAYWNGR